MKTDYKELREWTIKKLDWLHGFCSDSDLDLDRHRLAKAEDDIAGQIKQIREGRYRVVVLGAFNVGKSTLINALLGDEILPPLMEPCTAKTVHLMHSEKGVSVSCLMKSKLAKGDEAALKGIAKDALNVSSDRMKFEVHLHPGNAAAELRAILGKLVTIEAYSKRDGELAKVAEAIDEVHIQMKLPRWAEDVILTDTPGVHSMSETEEKITYSVIGQAHLVLLIFDAENGGNRHDFAFMQRIVENRRRQMFFAINRRDQLEEDDIDPTGERGPGRTIMQGLAGFVRDPELFFVSALYALRARQLDKGTVTLDTIRKSRAIKIPYDVETKLRKEPKDGMTVLADHLLKESGFVSFEERIADYLHNENKELAVVSEGLSLMGALGGDYLGILKRHLAVTKDPSALEDLKKQRASIESDLRKIKEAADKAFNTFHLKITGGMEYGRRYQGLTVKITELFNRDCVTAQVIKPMSEWLLDDGNLKKTLENDKLLPAVKKFETLVDDFQAAAIRELEADFSSYTSELEAELMKILGDLHETERDRFAKVNAESDEVEASQTWEYWRDTGGGAAAGATVGAIVGTFFGPGVGTGIGAAIGAGVGALAGALGRMFMSKKARREKLLEQFKKQAMAILIDGLSEEGKERKPPVKEVVQEKLAEYEHKIDFESREQFKRFCSHRSEEVGSLIAKEETIRSEKEQIIKRLIPKIETLSQLLVEVKDRRGGK